MSIIEQKIEQTKKELKEWFDSPKTEDFYLKQPLQKIKEMSEESKIRKSILNGYETLDKWYSNRFVESALN